MIASVVHKALSKAAAALADGNARNVFFIAAAFCLYGGVTAQHTAFETNGSFVAQVRQ